MIKLESYILLCFMKKVIIGLSGGVDSAVSAYLLKKEGYSVSAVFMQNWEQSDTDNYCTIKEDSIDAISVSDTLGIDIDIINFSKEYKEKVFNNFLYEYQNGRTPNPDILCNSEIKFKAFLDYANTKNADYIATGHYVGKSTLESDAILIKAKDQNKDQSYFLYRLNQEQIKKSIFPLANLEKSEVRKIANQIGLSNANKKDSTGICFIGERPFNEFLKQYLPSKIGNIVSLDGKKLGEHKGLIFYTIGQRKNIGIGGITNNDKPWYVVDKKLLTNELIVAQGKNNPALLKSELIATNLYFYNNKIIKEGEYTAKIRYRMQDATCKISIVNNETIKIKFNNPQFAITAGQSIVIYDKDFCIGGGIIN